MTRAHYLRMGALNGYGAKETMLLAPGLIYDMFALYLEANGVSSDEEVE